MARRRFLMLERARGDGAAPRRSPAEGRAARFVDLDPTGPEATLGSGPARRAKSRFGPVDSAEPPAPSVVADADGRPTTRCPGCGEEAARFASRCPCGEALDTRAVRRLNRRLWQVERRGVEAGQEA